MHITKEYLLVNLTYYDHSLLCNLLANVVHASLIKLKSPTLLLRTSISITYVYVYTFRMNAYLLILRVFYLGAKC